VAYICHIRMTVLRRFLNTIMSSFKLAKPNRLIIVGSCSFIELYVLSCISKHQSTPIDR